MSVHTYSANTGTARYPYGAVSVSAVFPLTGFTSQLGIKLDYKAISMEAKDSGAEIIAEKRSYL